MKIVGIDLAGVETRPSGFCVLDEKMNTETHILYSDKEIIKEVERIRPRVVAVDAPLSMPKGRTSLKRRSKIHLRECDRELLRMKIKFFPITLGPMRKLTERGIKLKKILEWKGFSVIEVYPGGAQDVLKIKRKQNGLEKLKSGLKNIGVKNLRDCMSGDELDAMTCAVVGKFYVENNFTALGVPEEGLIIMPKI